MKLEFSRQIFEESSNIKSHQNLSSGIRVVPRGQTDMTKLLLALREFANAPENHTIEKTSQLDCRKSENTEVKCELLTDVNSFQYAQ
jgi:hypothetical protein